MGEHCFISYSNADALDFATRLATELEGGQPFIKVWFDKNEMSSSGPDWDEQIAGAISTCKCLIFVMSVDSTARHSNCKTEWTWALKCKKPIICILQNANAEEQFSLLNRQKIDFTTNFEAGIAKLRLAVGRLDSPEGLLDELNHRLAEAKRDWQRARAEDQPRIQSEIEILNEQIKRQAEIVADPKAAEKRTEANIQSGLERERQPEKPTTGKSSTKFINPPPGVAPSYFQDRQTETKEIVRFLHDDAQRLLTVVGRGGVGKTAMVCRLLKHIENGDLPDDLISIFGETKVDGLVYLSESGSHRVNFANLFADLSKLLPDENAVVLERLYKDPQISATAKMAALLDQFPYRKVILLLDNIETLINIEIFGIGDIELDECLHAFLSGAHNGIKIILTTRIAPRPLNLHEPGRQRILYLDEGLESPYAENILREMDTDGKLGLKNAPDTLLAQAREYTRGFPRALEALFAILAADRYTSLGEILATGKTSMPVNVIQSLVGEAFHRLDGDAQKVMQALAVYNRPVSTAAIDYLLQPYLPGINSTPMLNRLVAMQFVRRESGRYYLHPVDREYALGVIPIEEQKKLTPSEKADFEALFKSSLSLRASQFVSSFTQVSLLNRAADYFAQTRKPSAEWKSLDDLNPQLAEFDLRCDAGNYDTASTLLSMFDGDYLLLWGHYHLMIDLHEKLLGKTNNLFLQIKSLNVIGVVTLQLGDFRKSIEYFQRCIPAAQELKNLQAEGTILNNLGHAFSNLGEYYKAIEFYEKSLAIAREFYNLNSKAITLNNIGGVYAKLGEIHKAIEAQEQALSITRKVKNRTNEATIVGNLGIRYDDLGEKTKAIELHKEALLINREIGNRSGEATNLGNLGVVYYELGKISEAIEFHEQALFINRELRLLDSEAANLGNLGATYSQLGETRKAIDFYQQALAINQQNGNSDTTAINLDNLGVAYRDLGEIRQAINFHQEALIINQQNGNRGQEAINLDNLGHAYHDLGEIRKAMEFHQQALNINREIEKRENEASSLTNLGYGSSDLGNEDEAVVFYQQALTIYQDMENRALQAANYNYIGNSLVILENYEDAENYFVKAIQIADEIELTFRQHRSRRGLAQMHLFNNNLEHACTTLEDAFQYNDWALPSTYRGPCLQGIITLRQGEKAEAEAAFKQAIERADDPLDKTPDYYDALNIKGLALCGLILCQDGLLTTESNEKLKQAEHAFRAAHKIAPHAGIIRNVLRLFDELTKCDPEGVLTEVRKTVAGLES